MTLRNIRIFSLAIQTPTSLFPFFLSFFLIFCCCFSRFWTNPTTSCLQLSKEYLNSSCPDGKKWWVSFPVFSLSSPFKASVSRAEDPGFDSCLHHGDFSGPSHTCDLALNFPVSVLKILIFKIHSYNIWQENCWILPEKSKLRVFLIAAKGWKANFLQNEFNRSTVSCTHVTSLAQLVWHGVVQDIKS